MRLSDLISNLLFLARTASPLTHLRLEQLDVTQLPEGVREYYDASAADAGVVLLNVSGNQPIIAELDRTLIQRALGNLVSNAVAHTLEGGTVVLKAHSEAANVFIEVSDTGVGIPAEALPKVFDRFYRVDPSRSKASGGTGLGLSIVQGIMKLHRGEVDIASQPGIGTQVTLRMPTRDRLNASLSSPRSRPSLSPPLSFRSRVCPPALMISHLAAQRGSASRNKPTKACHLDRRRSRSGETLRLPSSPCLLLPRGVRVYLVRTGKSGVPGSPPRLLHRRHALDCSMALRGVSKEKHFKWDGSG